MSDEKPGPQRGSRRGRPNDPERRDRIIDACLDVVSEVGVAGASHRKIAQCAGVPLGAMTYYFDGMDQLLTEAFTRFGTMISDRFEERLGAATNVDEACAAVAELVLNDVAADDRELVLAQELYTLAARDASFRAITPAWMARSRAALERHFDPATARMLDALIEGLTLHRALDIETRDPQEVDDAIRRLVGQ